MKYLLFTDPHLGKNLSSHTTAASRAALKDALELTAQGVSLSPSKEDPMAVLCLGDLFDTYTNDEATIAAGNAIAKRCSVVLAGNHDTVNNVDKMGSLQLINWVDTGERTNIIMAAYGTVHCQSYQAFTLVPHHSTQALFEQALDEAEGYAKNHPYLLLHCNYDSDFATADISLNLTRVRAEKLLAAGFKRIFIGHEHQPRDLLGGRVVILGNTHPTGFADISDKRVITLDTDADTVESRWIWKAADRFRKLAVEDFMTEDFDSWDFIEFFHVHGQIDATDMRAYVAQLKKAWKTLPNLFALRTEVTIRGGDGKAVLNAEEFTRITDRIVAELDSQPALLALWKEIAPATSIEAA